MNTDRPWRRFRYIEGRTDADLEFDSLTKGWWETAESLSPGSLKSLVEGCRTVTLPDGTRFREVSYKTEYEIMETALPVWGKSVGRRWAKVLDTMLVVSDGSSWPLSALKVDGPPDIDLEVGPDRFVASLLRKVWREEPNKAADPTPRSAQGNSGGLSED